MNPARLPSILMIAGSSLFAASTADAQNTSSTWNTDAAGNWTDILNWEGDTAYASGADNIATLGNFITANRIITLDADITIGGITASDTTHNYTISGTNLLTLDVTSGLPVIQVTANRTLIIESVIAGSDGLQKEGSGILSLAVNEAAPHANTYTGGTLINAGTITGVGTDSLGTGLITFGGNSELRAARVTGQVMTNDIQINSGVTGQLNATNQFYRFNISGTISGSGTLLITSADNGVGQVHLTNTNNTHTGIIRIGSASRGANLHIASIDDSTGAGAIELGSGAAAGNLIFAGTGSAQVFDDRQVVLSGTTGGGTILNNGGTANTLTFTQNLTITGTGNKTFTLGGSNTGANTFAGDIGDGVGSILTLNKGAAGQTGNWAISGNLSHSGMTWLHGGNTAPANMDTQGQLLLSGTNTNTGGYRVSGNGTLVFQGEQSLAHGSDISLEHSGGTNNSSRMRILSDTAGSVFLNSTIRLATANASGSQGIFVGNNHTANLGVSNGITTGTTIRIANLDFQTVASNINTSGIMAQITGANDYRLQIDNVTLNNLANRAALTTSNMGFNPTTANVTLGNVTQANGNVNKAVPILHLSGTSTDNRITGIISDAADFTDLSNAGASALTVNKSGGSTWTLSGTNTYTGATTVTAGMLEIGGGGTLGSGNYAGTISIASTSSGTFKYNSSANQTLSGVISGAGALVKDNEGILILSNNNTYTGATQVNGGTLIINGSTSSTSLVNVGSGATLGGSGTIGGSTTIAGTLAPGNSTGLLSFSNALTLAGAALMEINGTDLGLSSNGYDAIQVGGILTYGGTLTLNVGTLLAGGTYSFNLFDFANQSGAFSSVNLAGLYSGSLVNNGSGIWDLTDDDGNSWAFTQSTGDLGLTVIPEPRAAILSSLCLLTLLRRRR